MTEKELRQKVADTMRGWIGCKESNGTHKKIIDIYNNHKPLPRGYKVKYTDSWCATTVSAAYIKNNLDDIAIIECSCSKMIELAKKAGIWREADDYIPDLGDYCLYDWGDNGKGDNMGAPEHVGLVTIVKGKTFHVTEGNKNNSVGDRIMQVNGKNIRGFITPKFSTKAEKITSESVPTKAQRDKVDPARSFEKSYGKSYTVTASSLNMRTGPNTTKKIIKVLPKGTKVRCYGYYTKIGTSYWLLVKDSDGDVGYVSKNYLK